MRIVVDRARCEGHGLCEEAAPAADASRRRRRRARARPWPTSPRAEPQRRANAAVRVCPVAALRMNEPHRRRIVIVGNGIAGVTAAHSLRDAGYDGDLTLVGDEPRPAYSRPALSKALLRDDPDDTAHLLPPPGHGAVESSSAYAPTGLDVDGRQVLLDDGRRLDFDGLVIATGCRPRRRGRHRRRPGADRVRRCAD